jgi:hypothetical protein
MERTKILQVLSLRRGRNDFQKMETGQKVIGRNNTPG